MKQADEQTTQHEAELLRQIFAEPGQVTQDEEIVPLLDPPAGLTQQLYAIADADADAALRGHLARQSIVLAALTRLAQLPTWKSMAAVAASAVMVTVMLQMHEQRKTIAELEQAQRDLATALRYLNKANAAVEASLVNTLGDTMQKATVGTVVESINTIGVPTAEHVKPMEL